MRNRFWRGCPINLSDATILFADDEPILRDIFGKWLTAVGCKSVRTAKDGEDALAVFSRESIDLLITDVRMPILDGVGLVRRLAETANPSPSIIFISGFGDVDQREMYSLGVEAFVFKPCDRGELLGIVKRAIAERSTLWEIPAAIAPRQSISVVVERIGDSASEKTLSLGRGGFSVCYKGAVSLGEIAFDCFITSEDRAIAGQGCVRWKAPTEGKLGIEFSFIDETCRAWLVEKIRSIEPWGFIPGS